MGISSPVEECTLEVIHIHFQNHLHYLFNSVTDISLIKEGHIILNNFTVEFLIGYYLIIYCY